MKIDSIGLKIFRLFRSATFDPLPDFCVAVWANDSGKSTPLDVFGFRAPQGQEPRGVLA